MPRLPADGRWHDRDVKGSFRAVVSRLACVGSRIGGQRGSRRRICARARRSYVYARRFEFTVADFTAPKISVSGGSLLGAGTKAGAQGLSVTASDEGGGLSRTYLRVNGVPTAIHAYQCNLAKLDGGQVADRLSPCPAARTETLMTNASVAPFKPGANAVEACAADYSGSTTPASAANVTCSAPQTVIANGGCDKVAATNGNDAAAGTAASPYRSALKLANSLGFGQRGCLRAGTYAQNSAIDVTKPGITLTSFPGERATLRGELTLQRSASRVTFSNLNLDGRGASSISPRVYSADAVFDNLDVTNYNTEICFLLGANDSAGRAIRTLIENSRIHNCGKLPAQNGDHGIYAAAADGAIIRHNFIYDNADRGIQLHPDSQGSQVYGNVIDGNGEGVIISGNGVTASSNNLIRNNVISNSKLRWNIESSWPGGKVGTGNVVRDNCVWATNSNSYYRAAGGVQGDSPRGFVTAGNLTADPLFVSRFWKDFRLQPASPCVAKLG